jgi:hypothetical protein
MTHRGRAVFFLVVFVAAMPVFAQTTSDERIQQLEQKLDALMQQTAALRQELDQLKGVPPAQEAAADDLTKVGVVGTTEPAPPALTDVQTINNASNPGASKVFNPDTSVIGNFLGHSGKTNPFDPREPMQLDEAEIAFEAFVDPYAKAKFFFSASPEGVEVEEGFAQFIALPYDLTAKVGKFKANFGKNNTWHPHVRPWVDQPLVMQNFFGAEGLNDSGVSVSKVFPNSVAFVEGTVEAYRGEVEGVFGRQKDNDLFYNSHLKVFKDISENSNIEVGGSFARGTLAEVGGRNQFAGVDVTYRWKPLQRSVYNSLIARFEGIINDRADQARNLRGFYTSLDYQLGQRWFTGVRLDRSDAALEDLIRRDKGVSATLTFWPSEFSQIRGQLRHTQYGNLPAFNELLLQLQFSIGAHGAHAF